MNDYAVDLGRALGGEHLVPLVAADDIAGDLVPDDRIDIAEVAQTALDFFIRRIARLEVFPGIVFRRFQHADRQLFDGHFCIHGYLLAACRGGFFTFTGSKNPRAPNFAKIHASLGGGLQAESPRV